eukprot:6183503-Pleurochrysis_carterae.AAC.1
MEAVVLLVGRHELVLQLAGAREPGERCLVRTRGREKRHAVAQVGEARVERLVLTVLAGTIRLVVHADVVRTLIRGVIRCPYEIGRKVHNLRCRQDLPLADARSARIEVKPGHSDVVRAYGCGNVCDKLCTAVAQLKMHEGAVAWTCIRNASTSRGALYE